MSGRSFSSSSSSSCGQKQQKQELHLRSTPITTRRSRSRAAIRVSAKFELKPPPFELDALEKFGMSKETLEFHWGKHQATYVNNLNAAVEGTPDESKSLVEIMNMASKENKAGLFNNSGQVFNHEFWWEGLTPNGGGKPSGALLEALERDFGSFEEFATKFKAAAAPGPAFGSGWVWLVKGSDGKLCIDFTQNAENPISTGSGTPLFTCDVWEHAYYVDFRNNRAGFAAGVLEKLINWDKVSERFAAA